jgi:hypothetical protein
MIGNRRFLIVSFPEPPAVFVFVFLIHIAPAQFVRKGELQGSRGLAWQPAGQAKMIG